MADKDDVFEHDSIQDRKSIIKYLNAIIDGFRNGMMVFCSDDKRIVLEPRSLVKLSIEAKRSKGRQKFALKFSWRESEKTKSFLNDSLTIENE